MARPSDGKNSLLARTKKAKERFRNYLQESLKNHFLLTIAGFLCTAWFGISWFVYQIESPVKDSNIKTFGDSVWWGIVTLLTVGYGDRYPVSPEGRFFGGLLMLSGVFVIGILTAKISSYFLEEALREGRGFVDTDRLKNHFVVCGWKEDMHELLEHILAFNPDLDPEHLVLIANLLPTDLDALRANPLLKGMKIIVGDYYTEAVLVRAAPERARKIMILADRSINISTGQPSSMTEVDARTIMCAMTLHNIAKQTVVSAEIIDPKLDQYLKMAQVTEIIYSREYARLLIGNASSGTGIVNIIFDLMDPATPAQITTAEIPSGMVLKTYGELKSSLESARPGRAVVGVLENSGNNHSIKESALRSAQKTPDMKQLLSNLKSVKEIRCNHPVFNPPLDWVVPEGSLAIVIENRSRRINGKEKESQNERGNLGSKQTAA